MRREAEWLNESYSKCFHFILTPFSNSFSKNILTKPGLFECNLFFLPQLFKTFSNTAKAQVRRKMVNVNKTHIGQGGLGLIKELESTDLRNKCG